MPGKDPMQKGGGRGMLGRALSRVDGSDRDEGTLKAPQEKEVFVFNLECCWSGRPGRLYNFSGSNWRVGSGVSEGSVVY